MSKSFQQIIGDVRQNKISPIYFLSGDEVFFIDEIEEAILKNSLQPGQEDFNLDILYGKDVSNISEVLSVCQQYPVFADRRVVVLREAQQLNRKDQWELLSGYLQNPLLSTILVISYKYKSLDKRWDVSKKIIAHSIYFEAAKLKEFEVPQWIKSQVESRGFHIQDMQAVLIAENLGNDLSRIDNEIDKLSLSLSTGATIDAETIEKYIGISREYNSFELSNAVQQHDINKAVKIIHYFSLNPKSGPFPLIIGTMYAFFSKLWLYYQLPPNDKNNNDVVNKTLGGYYYAKNVKAAARFYSAHQAENAVAVLAEYDAKSKGIDNKNASDSELMLEMVYKLMN